MVVIKNQDCLKPSVCVFMSTYNGEKFLKQQVDSILNQADVNVTLFIRDDGSSDSTVSIVEEYIAKGNKIQLFQGDNVGFEHSFAKVSRLTLDFDFFAFSDQDDIWCEKRLINAIEKIKGFKDDEPVLYGSNFFITDGEGNIQKSLFSEKKMLKTRRKMQKYGILFCNMFACTMVWNKPLQELLMKHEPASRISHDVWTQLICEISNGNIIFDSNQTILHRIHGNNTAGIENSFLSRAKKGIKVYLKSGISSKNEIVNEALTVYEEKEDDKSTRKKSRDCIRYYNKSFFKKIKMVWLSFKTGDGLQRKLFRAYLVIKNKF